MKFLLVSLIALTSTAYGGSLAPITYHDGTLVAAPDARGCTTPSQQNCNNADEYLVQSEGILYALTPLSAGERATLGWGKQFSKYSSLDHQPAGTLLKVRDDGKHFFVKVGNRESMYLAIETR